MKPVSVVFIYTCLKWLVKYIQLSAVVTITRSRQWNWAIQSPILWWQESDHNVHRPLESAPKENAVECSTCRSYIGSDYSNHTWNLHPWTVIDLRRARVLEETPNIWSTWSCSSRSLSPVVSMPESPSIGRAAERYQLACPLWFPHQFKRGWHWRHEGTRREWGGAWYGVPSGAWSTRSLRPEATLQ